MSSLPTDMQKRARAVAARAVLSSRPSPWSAWAVLITEHGPRSWEVLSVPRTELLNLLRAFPAYLSESGISAEMVARMSQSRERVPVLVLYADGETIELDFVDEDDLRTVAATPGESLFGPREVADA